MKSESSPHLQLKSHVHLSVPFSPAPVSASRSQSSSLGTQTHHQDPWTALDPPGRRGRCGAGPGRARVPACTARGLGLRGWAEPEAGRLRRCRGAARALSVSRRAPERTLEGHGRAGSGKKGSLRDAHIRGSGQVFGLRLGEHPSGVLAGRQGEPVQWSLEVALGSECKVWTLDGAGGRRGSYVAPLPNMLSVDQADSAAGPAWAVGARAWRGLPRERREMGLVLTMSVKAQPVLHGSY